MGASRLVTVDGSAASIPESTIDGLRAKLQGDLVDPDDGAYEETRLVWNGMIDKRPALIARCSRVPDVAEAVAFARETGVLLAVRGGGHGVAGNAVCDGGLVIDLSPLRAIEVDPDRKLVRAQGGCRLGEVDAATQAHGLATPLGVVSQTGIAGLTLSGGIGYLRRKHGLSSDNLVSAEVVTADGRVLKASEGEHADLFWALRGGGGNFGIVTTFEYRLHPLGPEVMTLFVLYPGERAKEILQTLRGFMERAPDDFSPLSFLGFVPDAEPFPVESHGQPYVAIAGPYGGDAEAGERAVQPLRELGDAIVDLSERMPYVEAQKLLDEDYPDGKQYYWKSIELGTLSDAAIDKVIEHALAAPAHHSTVDVWFHGGAMGRIPPEATAFGDRAAILLGYEANFDDPAEADENVAWVRESIEDVRPLSTGGAYLNFPGFFEEGEELLRASYGEANYERLVALKAEYDPGNLFRLNGNIGPGV